MNNSSTSEASREPALSVDTATLKVIRERLIKAEDALVRIRALNANRAITADLTMQQRRDVAWNKFQEARTIAWEGLI